MRIYFLRHGEADWPNWTGPDSERPLTDKGLKEMKTIAEGIAGLKFELAAILTSPYRRASQTAEVVASALGIPAKVEPALVPGFDGPALGALIERHAGGDLMVVGHEPDFSYTIRALTGGDVKMARAGFACVEIIDPQALRGELVWLIPPRVFKAAGRTLG
jgi:phosphohistidine phosphatase